MTFANWAILIVGLAAVAIPIAIHLLNRRQPPVINWGAMQFLSATLTSRKRKLMLEDVLLMSARCALMTLIAVTLGRPFLPAAGTLPLHLVVAGIVGATICAAVAGATWQHASVRWALLTAASVLLLTGMLAAASEAASQDERWSTPDGKDVVIIIDASGSMQMSTRGKTAFLHAIDEARKLVKAMKSGDASTIVLAASRPKRMLTKPTADKTELRSALQQARPIGGTMDLCAAISDAADSLARGRNPDKRIVIITDGQKGPWSEQDSQQWRNASAAFSSFPRPPRIIFRTLLTNDDLETFSNVAVSTIDCPPAAAVRGRRGPINVELANTGLRTVAPVLVRLEIDAKHSYTQRSDTLRGGSKSTITFHHTFKSAGTHVLTASIIDADNRLAADPIAMQFKESITTDNAASRILSVAGQINVLIVSGQSRSGAAFIRSAMNPLAGHGKQAQKLVIQPAVVSLADFLELDDLSPYEMIVLADVPQLSRKSAKTLRNFVRDGGAMLITPGSHTRPGFYNAWSAADGTKVLPASFGKWQVTPQSPAAIAAVRTSTPSGTLAQALAGLDETQALARWNLTGPQGTVLAKFEDDSPALLHGRFFDGQVILSAFSFDTTHSDLARRPESFVPVIHELTYWLAADKPTLLNIPPGQTFVCSYAINQATIEENTQLELETSTPSNRNSNAVAKVTGNQLTITFTHTDQPGLYRILLGKSLATMLPPDIRSGDSLSMSVTHDVAESKLTPDNIVNDSDMELLSREIDIFHADTGKNLQAAASGKTPGREVAMYVAVLLMVLAVGEIALARWVASARGAGKQTDVSFARDARKVQQLRDQLMNFSDTVDKPHKEDQPR